MSRRGKIARLPNEVREELNRRLLDGASGKSVVEWLNSLPAARAVLRAEFGGKPIRKQNLSEWMHGGYRDWLKTEVAMAEVRRLVERGQALKESGRGALSDYLATWVAAQYAVTTSQLQSESKGGPLELKDLRELCRDVSGLRRGDHEAARLRLEEERQKQKSDSGAKAGG